MVKDRSIEVDVLIEVLRRLQDHFYSFIHVSCYSFSRSSCCVVDTDPRGQNRPSNAEGASFHQRSNTFAVAFLTPLSVVLVENVEVIFKFLCHLSFTFEVCALSKQSIPFGKLKIKSGPTNRYLK